MYVMFFVASSKLGCDLYVFCNVFPWIYVVCLKKSFSVAYLLDLINNHKLIEDSIGIDIGNFKNPIYKYLLDS